jgi:hypothetical protein
VAGWQVLKVMKNSCHHMLNIRCGWLESGARTDGRAARVQVADRPSATFDGSLTREQQRVAAQREVRNPVILEPRCIATAPRPC